MPVIPQATNPLSRDYIGYGVVNVSFANLMTEPGPDGNSTVYLRRGTVVRITGRRLVPAGGDPESWVLAEGNYQGSGGPDRGWLPETAVEIYDNESKAKTASESMNL